jgi:hypothetical protein
MSNKIVVKDSKISRTVPDYSMKAPGIPEQLRRGLLFALHGNTMTEGYKCKGYGSPGAHRTRRKYK